MCVSFASASLSSMRLKLDQWMPVNLVARR